MAKWYYAKGTTQQGPVDLMTLRGMLSRGELDPSDLVWREGFSDWIAASSAPEVSGPIAPTVYPSAQGGALSYAVPRMYEAQGPTERAGFWLRFGAWVIDWIITAIGGLCVGGCMGGAMGGMIGAAGGGGNSARMRAQMSGLRLTGQLIGIVIGWLYYALMESSNSQATLGKMACGIIVTDLNGEKISFGRATGRHFAKILSGLILLVGYMMAGWTEKKQALHDMIASTLVMRKPR